jgi:alpha-L-rhamnosidase
MKLQSRIYPIAAYYLLNAVLPIPSVCAKVLPPTDSAIWITHPEAGATVPIVLHFRREIDLSSVPSRFPVRVSADNRFVLYVNGSRVGTGPATSDLAHWRYERFDLAAFLIPGKNVIEAVVWNFTKPPSPVSTDLSTRDRMIADYRAMLDQPGAVAQISAQTGFWISAEQSTASAIDSGPQWRTSIDPGHSAESGMKQVKIGYYIAGAAETIDARVPKSPWTAAVPAISAHQATPWTMSADPLPQMSFHATASGRVTRSDLAVGWRFPANPIEVPARSHVHILLQRAAMISAYPELITSGGRGATITMTYAEALYDADKIKGVRDVVGTRTALGLSDTFISDGSRRAFAPLWWRTWRFLDIDVETSEEPLRLDAFRTYETGYPFQKLGLFESNDSELNEIWRIGWRTALIDAHETYMDSAYWEQLQYAGDTRLQMLISYAVSGDSRLAVQALDAFGYSYVDHGLTEGAYPSRTSNVIPPFSLLWIGMLHDFWWQQPDTNVVRRNLPRAREILGWYAPYLEPNGLLRKNPHWNFVDWAMQHGKPLAREAFPSFDASGESCLTSLFYLGALRQAADLEHALGDSAIEENDSRQADRVRGGIRSLCWDETRHLFADDPSKQVFSQHTNALAVLYDVSDAADAPVILDSLTTTNGIDAPDTLITTSYYFSWYLIRAYEHAGLADRYVDLLATWRALLALKYSTWPEERGNTRSDSHAWSAHPTADLLGVVAGIQSSSPGYASVLIAPHLGGLTSLKAVALTPAGSVKVDYTVIGRHVIATIHKPRDLPGTFFWKARSYPLLGERRRFVLER